MSRNKGLGLVFLAALALRLPTWASLERRTAALEGPDTATYVEPARHLSKGEGFKRDGRVEASRTPGYPLFIALAGSDNPRLVAFSQVVVDAGTAALAALAADMLAPGSGAWACGLLYALDPVAAAHAPLLLTETLFSFLVALGVVVLLRAGARPAGLARPAAAGLCFGVATLVRPITLYLWIPWSLALAREWKGGARRALLAFAGAAALLPALWCARNAALWGRFEFSAITGVNALYWEAAAVRADAERTTLVDARQEIIKEYAARHPTPFADPFEESRARREMATEILSAHPLLIVKLHAVSTIKMLLGPGLDLVARAFDPNRDMPSEESLVYSVAGKGTLALLRASPGLWLVLGYIGLLLAMTYGFAVRGAWTLWRGKKTFELCAVGLPLLYLLLLSGGGWAYYRFRLPMMPLFAIFAGAALPRKRR